ncbi:MAG: carbohydrate ABC transporter permease [Kribbellaceae bacterium]
MGQRVLLAGIVVVGTPIALYAWLWLAEQVERLTPRRFRVPIRAWLWLAPAAVLIGTFLIWPLANTGWLSLHGADGRSWAGPANLDWLIRSSEVHAALRNNLLWLILLVGGCLALGLLVAVLTDSVRYEGMAKAVVVAPTAISFVCGAIIWRFMFDYQAPGLPQIGTLNAAWADALNRTPVAWLVDTRTNNYALITVGFWMTLGFATVIISAALKGVPAELTDAARVDGASRWQALRYVVLPQLQPTLVVVATLVAIMALKAFDIVYVMTNGNYGTDVIANLLYSELFLAQNSGRASAIALLLTALAIPMFMLNAYAQRRETRRM